MTRFRSVLRRPVCRWAVLVSSTLPLSGCMSWQHAATPAPAQSRTIHGPIRVMRQDGYTIELESAEVRGDSIVGLERRSLRHAAVALSDVHETERQRVDVLNSLLATAGAAAAVFSVGVLYLMAVLSGDNS